MCGAAADHNELVPTLTGYDGKIHERPRRHGRAIGSIGRVSRNARAKAAAVSQA